LEKYSNIKFHKNPSNGSRVVPCGRTDRHDEYNSRCSQFFQLALKAHHLNNIELFILFPVTIFQNVLWFKVNYPKRGPAPTIFTLYKHFPMLMFVDPCIIVKFIKKNPTRCNNVSKFYYSIII